MIHFDHIEVHVKDSMRYAEFLKKIFNGGRFKKISENNTYMFLSPDNFHIEIKERVSFTDNFSTFSGVGFCLPCIRMKGALEHIKSMPGINIINQVENPDGTCYFFKDYEGIDWHIKDYEIQDIFINI